MSSSFFVSTFKNYSSILQHKNFNILLCFAYLFTSCLPIDEDQPDCFPEEGCPTNFVCQEGRCVEPRVQSININLQCLKYSGCDGSLASFGFDQACLLVEQPQTLYSTAFNFNQAREEGGTELELPIQEAPLRASVVLLSSQLSSAQETVACPTTAKEIEQSQFHRECRTDKGCLLRLRIPTIQIDLSTASTVEFNFTHETGHCLESMWSIDSPQEVCSSRDLDCDGFVDEGVICE